jgi:hypothetical protein
MSLRFMMSGGNFSYLLSQGPTSVPNIWQLNSAIAVVTTAPAGRSTNIAYGSGQNMLFKTGFFPSTYSGLIAGFACYLTQFPGANIALINFNDGSGNSQCDVRVNSVGQLYFTRNGTQIGSTSSAQYIFTNAWFYIEFKALFSTSSTGTCETRINGVVANTATSVQNATTSAVGGQVEYQTVTQSGGASYATDFYALDTAAGTQTGYQGDISVIEIYPNTADQAMSGNWTVLQGTFTLTQATVSGGSVIYTGTITNGTSNAWQGYYFTTAGFTNSGNNGTFVCTASSGTTLTLTNASGVNETHAGTAAFQSPLQSGIVGGFEVNSTTNIGTRPQSDNLQYIYSSTPGQESWYGHQTLTLTGTISGVAHVTLARKDDGGGTTRQIAQIAVESGSVVETGTTQTLGTSYQYFMDVLETDPGTSVAWTTAGFNGASFGVDEIA